MATYTVTDNELNVVQGFGERQLVRNTEATVTPGLALTLESDNEWDLAAADSAPATKLIAIAQNKSSNLDAQGSDLDFVGADAKVIGIPVSSGAEVEIPDAALAANYAAVVGAPIYLAASGKLDDSGTIKVGTVTGDTTAGVTVLLQDAVDVA